MARAVVVTGIGVISPIGVNVAELLANLRDNRSGIRLWESPQLSKKFPAGCIEHDFSGEFSKLDQPYLDRCSQIAILAARQAAADAGVESFAEYGIRAGVFHGSVGGGVHTEHEWVRQFHVEEKHTAKPYTIMACMLNAAPAHISIRYQILGPVMTYSSACTSSGSAIGDGPRDSRRLSRHCLRKPKRRHCLRLWRQVVCALAEADPTTSPELPAVLQRRTEPVQRRRGIPGAGVTRQCPEAWCNLL